MIGQVGLSYAEVSAPFPQGIAWTLGKGDLSCDLLSQ
jgi:hypothetical protein